MTGPRALHLLRLAALRQATRLKERLLNIAKALIEQRRPWIVENPDAVIRWMCKQWKLGNGDWWIAYKNKSYKAFL